MKKELGIAVLLVVLCIATAIKNPIFLSPENVQNLLRLVGIYGIFSIGLGLVIITGGIDLSVGSVFALLGVVFCMMVHGQLNFARANGWEWPWSLALLVALIGTSLLGAIHGFLITRVKLQPFVVTLCGLLIYRGAARFIAGDQSKGVGTT